MHSPDRVDILNCRCRFAPPVQVGRRGERVRTVGTGTGGQPPVGLDELEPAGIDPLPSWVRCQDMADFAESITDEHAGHRLCGLSRAEAPSADSGTSSMAGI